jgi:hypothetical protein
MMRAAGGVSCVRDLLACLLARSLARLALRPPYKSLIGDKGAQVYLV